MRFGMVLAAALVAGFGGVASADVLTGKAAKKLLYSGDKLEAEVLPQTFLPEDQAKLLESVAVSQPYYGAIAVSPDEGLMSQATIAAANYHSVEAASVAALAGCEAAKKGKAACVVVAYVRPKGWEARPIQMSSDATTAFRKDYGGKGGGGKGGGGKGGALAVSASTGAWGMAKGDGAADAAIAACAANVAGVTDCAVIIAD